MAAKSKTRVKQVAAHDSPFIQIGIAFVIIAALFLMFYAGSLNTFN